MTRIADVLVLILRNVVFESLKMPESMLQIAWKADVPVSTEILKILSIELRHNFLNSVKPKTVPYEGTTDAVIKRSSLTITAAKFWKC